ncbi:conjugative transposon protein TraN [Runella sp. MFBS21]|uniref:conjugative transposon protein TraN n=1 Tax=Runella sp. MFBS21 TaxID=3034018 RepID=UPI0023F6ACE6|nr:conjugative transposon protein TraN [Runella sp. MFBS21]MDF7821867.1 conjugative transposon protein TraN [Runella sp. MFBS21]
MKKLISLFLLPFFLQAQRPVENANKQMFNEVFANRNQYLLALDKASVIGSYPLGVSEQKTVHVLFPSEIKEIDVGNQNVIVQVTEAFNNVLRVKANARGTFKETNVTVICKDGKLYSFLANYQDNPEVINLSIGYNQTADERISKELGINFHHQKVLDENDESFTEIQDLSERALDKRNYISNVGVYTMKVTALLRGIYTKGDNLYYQVEVKNRSEIDYRIDFAKVFISDISEIKRVAVQEEEVPVKYHLPTDKNIPSNTDKMYVFVVPVKAISASKQVDFEIFEEKGARHLRFTISHKLIQKAKQL